VKKSLAKYASGHDNRSRYGKWAFRALVLLKIESGEVKWQRDLLKQMQQEILARTRKAKPRKYAASILYCLPTR
jgi:hypothetical protein